MSENNPNQQTAALAQRINEVIDESGCEEWIALNAVLAVMAIRGLVGSLLRLVGIDHGKF